MSIGGKLSGAIIGGIVGGPIGILIGGVAGHLFVDMMINDEQPPNEQVFFVALFGMLGKLAKADGVVTQDEVTVVQEFMKKQKLPKEARVYAGDIFNKAKDEDFTFQEVARQFASFAAENYQLKILAADILFNVAAADGVLHPSEEEMLLSMKNIFGLQDSQYNSIKSRYFDQTEDYYSVLSCTPSSTNEEIKKSYKKLVSDFHPDKVIAKGLPKEFVDFADKRFKEIQEAYEQIRKARDF